MTIGRGVLGRSAARVWAGCLTAAVAVVDAGPDILRFGHGRTIRNRILARSLPAVVAPPALSPPPATVALAGAPRLTVVLVTRSLGTGGVEAIVATLARELPGHSVRAEVLCEHLGTTADALRRDGVRVVEARDQAAAAEYLQGIPVDAVAELHNAPDHLIEACRQRGLTLVPVIHTTDINLGPDRWEQEAELAEAVPVSIAVSQTVRDFYLQHLPRSDLPPVVVVHNGAQLSGASSETAAARRSLADSVGLNLSQATIFCCLARYDLQKNLPGLVASFLRACEQEPELHLVVAGPAEDWLEHALANAIRRSHPAGGRIHLMGISSARTLLEAADAFILDSFFEGWPVSATEAVLAGLPVILPEVGGAIELAGPDGCRGWIFPNPAGAPERITLDEIRRARRRPLDQRNRAGLAGAVLRAHADIDIWRSRRAELAVAAREWLGASSMARAHADLLLRVASGATFR